MAWQQLAPQVIQQLSSDLNITPQQAAGIVGQLGYESAGLQAINEQNPIVPGSRGGFGWAQWTGPRRRQFESWAQQNQMDVNTPEANYGFLVHELTATPESRVLDSIRQADNAQDAGRIFTDTFLRPGIPAYDKRASWTDRALSFIMPTAQAGTLPKIDESQITWDAAPAIDPSTVTWDDAGDQDESGGYLRQIGSGLLEGITGALGAPIDITNAAIGLGLKGVNSVFGTNLQPSSEPLGGSRGLRRGLPIAPPSNNSGEQMARRVAQSVGGAAVPVAASAKTAGQLATGLATAFGGGVGGATAQQLFPDNPSAEIIGELVGGLGTGGAITGLANRSARRSAEQAVPTVGQLKQRASELYDAAEQNGVIATQAQTQGLADDFRAIAQQEGLITPTGRVSEAYPRAAEALRVMDDYATGTMTPTQMQVVRDTLSDAANATKGKESRIASMMLRAFDDFTAPLAPQLAQARALYSRAARGQQLETLRELAGARAGQFTGSGFENALRTEYRGLDRRITQGKERGWSPDQVEAINRVSRGTRASNIARNVGKLAPTGVVSMGLGGGVPFAVGNAIGGPALGSTLGAATMGAGFLGRDIATRYGIRHADLAELLARNGGLLSVNNPNLWPQTMGGLLGGQIGIHSN